MMDSFSRKSEDFLDWFKALPGSTFHKDIAIRDLRAQNAGRGIVATRDIPEDAVLFTIPRSAIICPSTSSLRGKISSIFSCNEDVEMSGDDHSDPSGEGADISQQDSWTVLILIMLHEYLRGAHSPWKAYLDVLPSEFDTLMFWSPDEIKELQASPVVEKIGRLEADAMIRSKILPVIHEHPSVFFSSGVVNIDDEGLMALAHRMGSIIMAYAFDLDRDEDEEQGEENDDEWVEDKDDKKTMGMVPMADILNADAQFNAHINHEDDALTATALRPIKAGEEILNYYGPLSNGELLRRYGYTTQHHGRYDVAELPWELVLSCIQSRIGLTLDEIEKILGSLDLEDLEDSFVIDRNLEEADSTGRLPEDGDFQGLPSELEEQVKAFLKAVRKTKPDAIPDKRKRDEIYLSVVQDAIARQLAKYPTSIEEDARLLQGSRGRLRMAIEVRMGEKALLLAARDFVTGKLREARGEGNSEQPSKRARKH